MADADPVLALANDIGAFTADPLGYATYAFTWGEGDLADMAGPRTWQRAVMAEIRDHLSDPARRFQPLRVARASGHGIGKSALIGMLVKWALDTCPDTRVIVTANTEAQLRTKTAPELAKWAGLALTSAWFRHSATAITSTMAGREKSWRCDLVTWSESNTEAFAGLHNQGKRIVLVFDEASGIADKVWEVALGALTDADTEIIWLAFGNPTRPISTNWSAHSAKIPILRGCGYLAGFPRRMRCNSSASARSRQHRCARYRCWPVANR